MAPVNDYKPNKIAMAPVNGYRLHKPLKTPEPGSKDGRNKS